MPAVVTKVDGLDVPFIKHPSLKPFVKDSVLGTGKAPHATEIVTADGAIITGKVAGLTVIILETAEIDLLQLSVAVQVSVTVPPHAEGLAVNVDACEVPLIKQFPLKPLLNAIVLAIGIPPQATVIAAGAVSTGKAAGVTVMILETDAITLLQWSVAVHVSVTFPPQADGVAVNVDA